MDENAPIEIFPVAGIGKIVASISAKTDKEKIINALLDKGKNLFENYKY